MADIKISQETLIWLGSSLVLCAIAFATIGATAKDNKEENRIQSSDIKANRERIHAQELAAAQNAQRQMALIKNQEQMISKIDGLYYAEDVSKHGGK